MPISHVFKHLRKRHRVERGGKLKSRQTGVDLTDLIVCMSATNVRDLIVLEMNMECANFLRKLRSMKMLPSDGVDWPAILFEKRVTANLHIIEAKLPCDMMTAVQVERVPFNVETSFFSSAAANSAKYNDRGLNEILEILFDGARYKLEDLLGEGSFAKCYRISAENRPKLACKVIRKDNHLMHLIKDEVGVHSKVSHENIVQFISSFEDEKNRFIILELCDSTLKGLMDAQFFAQFKECRDLVRQILNGVGYLHENRIIHRDLKLDNILISDGRMKICDFGLAIFENAPADELRKFCGTAVYMSPEVLARSGAVPRSDIWSVGVITFRLYKGIRPFDAEDEDQVYERIRNVAYNVADYDEPLFVEFIQSIFQADFNLRPTAEQCLTSPMFTFMHLEHARMPREDEEIEITLTHILGPNKVYVQITNNMQYDEFQQFQFNTLQMVQLKSIDRVPGNRLLILIERA